MESLAAIPGFLRKGLMGVRSVVWSSLLWLQKNLNNNYCIYKCTNRHLFTNNINGWSYLICSCVNELCEEKIHVFTVSKMPFTWWPYFIQTFNRKDMINLVFLRLIVTLLVCSDVCCCFNLWYSLWFI